MNLVQQLKCRTVLKAIAGKVLIELFCVYLFSALFFGKVWSCVVIPAIQIRHLVRKLLNSLGFVFHHHCAFTN